MSDRLHCPGCGIPTIEGGVDTTEEELYCNRCVEELERNMSTNKPVGGAQFTPGPWVAIKGDTFNPERPWGVSKYLSREAHIEIDGDDKEYPCRTEVIAELTETENPQEVEHTAYLIAAAPAMYEALVETMRVLRSLRDSKEEWYTLVTPELLNVWDRNKQAISQAEGRHHE